MKSIKTPNHPAYHWSTLWPLEVWVRGLYNSLWFCVHNLSMFIYLSMVKPYNQSTLYLHIAGGRLNQTRLEINDGEHFSVNIFKHSMMSS